MLKNEIEEYVQDKTLRKGMDTAVIQEKNRGGLKNAQHSLQQTLAGLRAGKNGKV